MCGLIRILYGNPSACTRVYCGFIPRLMGQHKYGDALELLMAGSEALFQAGQSASGSDLALLVLELYSQSHTAVNDESRGACADMLLEAERVRSIFY